MLFMFGRNKRTCMGESSQLASTQMSLKVVKVSHCYLVFVLATDQVLRPPHCSGTLRVSSRVIDNVFPSPDNRPSNHLAYVEWFSPIPATPEPKHSMYKVSRVIQDRRRSASIIPVEAILASVHLFPRFGAVTTPSEFSTSTVLDHFQTFYINPFSDAYHYMLFGHQENN
jgi:hypothetical protein